MHKGHAKLPDSAAATNTSRTQVADASQVWTLLAVAVAAVAAPPRGGGGEAGERGQSDDKLINVADAAKRQPYSNYSHGLNSQQRLHYLHTYYITCAPAPPSASTSLTKSLECVELRERETQERLMLPVCVWKQLRRAGQAIWPFLAISGDYLVI